MSKRLIYAEDAIEALCKVGCKSGYCGISCDDVKAIEQLPSTQPQRIKGHWERHNTYHGDDTSGSVDPDWRCSVCGKQAIVNEWFFYELTDFCPSCGADMRDRGNEPCEI